MGRLAKESDPFGRSRLSGRVSVACRRISGLSQAKSPGVNHGDLFAEADRLCGRTRPERLK